MTAPTISGRFRSFPASTHLDDVAKSLEAIRTEDNLSYVDLGAELAKGDDMASRYCKGTGDMPATTFLRACHLWNGRFANRIFARLGMKLVMIDGSDVSDRRGMSSVLRAVATLTEHLEDDDRIDDVELRSSRDEVEAAGAYFDRLRERLHAIDAAATS